MRIYLAGLFSNNLGVWPIIGENKKCFVDFKYPWHLESYHYIGKNRGNHRVRTRGDTIFIDSGAFSAFTQGIEINMDEYIQYVKDNQDIIHLTAALDVIGDAKQSWDNFLYMKDKGVDAIPTYHYLDHDFKYLERMVKEVGYLAIGGVAQLNARPKLESFLDKVWSILTDSNGKPIVKVHGFAVTNVWAMRKYPWYSVDSTSYVAGSKFGCILLDFSADNIQKINIARDSKHEKKWGDHFQSLNPIAKKRIEERLNELGYSSEALLDSYALRDKFNCEFFRRAMEWKTDHFKPEEKGLFD